MTAINVQVTDYAHFSNAFLIFRYLMAIILIYLQNNSMAAKIKDVDLNGIFILLHALSYMPEGRASLGFSMYLIFPVTKPWGRLSL
jgi:hypothetical protein